MSKFIREYEIRQVKELEPSWQCIAMHLIETALCTHNEMTTFAESGVRDRDRFHFPS